MSQPPQNSPALPTLDWSRLHLGSRQQRRHKVTLATLARLTPPGASFQQWLAALPDCLGASQLRQIVQAMVRARRARRGVVLAFGGHVVKAGCSPVVIDLIERGVVTAVASNGSGAIHDLELAESGATSEEVSRTLREGRFGMVRETCERLNEAARRGAAGMGLGRAVGELIEASGAPHKHLSILAAAARRRLPATLHVAIGTDTVHMHPQADGAEIGRASLIDFRTLCAVVAGLGAARPGQAGGVWLNVGSAVVLPEVFLKAVAVARNLGHDLDAMHTANLDMLQHYRPTQNVLTRPVAEGHGHAVVGQHELLLPLLRQAVLEALASGAAPAGDCRSCDDEHR